MVTKESWIIRKQRYGITGRKDGKIIGFKKGHKPHNKGLHISTDPKHSIKMRKAWKEGKYKNRKINYKDAAKKISRTVKQRWKEGVYDKSTLYLPTPNIGKYEKEILDFIEPALGFPIIRQHRIKRYAVDGYCPQRNIVFEVDEKLKGKQKDMEREKYIKEKLKCIFIRIPTH